MKPAARSLLALAVLFAATVFAPRANAQGPSSEYPTGYGYTQSVTSAPATNGLATLSPTQRLAWWVSRGFAPADGRGGVAGFSASRSKRSAVRPAGSSGEQGPKSGLSNRSLVRPVGR